jgi:hypothetical protein
MLPLPAAVVDPALRLHWLLERIPATPTVSRPVNWVPASFNGHNRLAARSYHK